MPAIGTRGPLAPRKIREAQRRPAPTIRQVPAAPQRPVRAPSAPVRHATAVLGGRGTALPQRPFQGVQKAAAQRAAKAQQAIPAPQHPFIPLVPNPSPHQTTVALGLIRHSQKQALGPNPSAARIREYHQEIATDPRLRQFREAIKHYFGAGEQHQASLEGERYLARRQTRALRGEREAPPEGTGMLDALGRLLSAPFPRKQATVQQVGRAVLAEHRPERLAQRAAPYHSSGGPLGGVPLLPATIKNYLGERLAEDAPKLAAVGQAGLNLLTTPTPTGHNVLSNALADVANIGRVPLIGAYQFGGAGIGAAQGNLKAAQQLAKGIGQGVAHGAVGQLAQGNIHGFLRALQEHPVLSPLEAAGAEALVGRAAGAVARGVGAGGVEGAFGRAVSRVRSPIALGQDIGNIKRGHVEQRTGSPDLIRGLVQQALDRQRGYPLDAKGRPIYRAEYGRKVPVVKAREGRFLNERERLEQRRGNFYSAGHAAAIRQVREKVPHELAKALPKVKGRLARSLILPASTGTILTAKRFEADIVKRIKLIEHKLENPEENYRHEADQAAAEANLKTYRAALADPKVLAQKEQIVRAGEVVARMGNAGDAELERLGVYPAGRLERGRLSEVALAHVPGAKHGTAIEPEDLALHEASVTAHDAAKMAVSRAEDTLRRAEDRRAGRVGLQRSARMRGEPTSSRGFFTPGKGSSRTAFDRPHPGLSMDVEDRAAQLFKMQTGYKRVTGTFGRELTALKESMRERAAREIAELAGPVRRGARPSTAAERNAMGAHDENVRVAKQQLKDARAHEQETGEALLPKPKETPAIRDAEGNYLTNEAIRQHVRASGRNPDTVAYMPHRLDERISRSYYKSLRESRPIGGALERTGHLYEGGSTAISLDAIREELTNKAVTATTVKAFDRLAGDAGLRHPDYQGLLRRAKEGDTTLTRGERAVVQSGGELKWTEAHELADRLQREGKGNFIPMRAHAARLDKPGDVRRAQGTAQMESAHQALFNDRFTDNGSAANNVVLMPKELVDRIKAQNTPAREFERWGRLLNVAFRYTVLPQFKWLAGNFIEPYFIRLPLSGSGINLPGLALDLHAAHKVIKHMENSPNQALKDAAANIRAQQLDPGLFIGGKAGSVHTNRSDISGPLGKMMAEAAKLGGKEVKGFPVLHQLGQLAIALPKFFFYFNRHFIENPAQRAAFGKSVRQDMQKWTGQWHKTVLLGQQAVDEASRGLLNTATQHRFLKEQHILLGQYDTFGPGLRHLIQGYTPFLPWTLASLRFVYWTLPIHHTVAFNALMKAGQSVLPEWEADHAGTPPGDLRYSPKWRGGYVDLPRLTPFGVSVPLSTEGPGAITEAFAPQVRGAQEAFKGKGPFGEDLALPSGEKPTGLQKAGIGAYSLLEALVPYLATARRLQEGGGTSAATSTVWNPQAKPGTAHISPWERTLSPIRPIYTKAPVGNAREERRQARHEARQARGDRGKVRGERRKAREEARRARGR